MAKAVREILAVLGPEDEAVFVDDGSRDGTVAALRPWLEREPRLRLLALPGNRGKGAAVRAGMLAARGAVRVFRDADSSTPMETLAVCRAELERGADVAIASRRVPGARFARRQRALRDLLGRGFTFLCRLLLVWEVRDFTCGFKCYTAKAAAAVFSRQRLSRWAFDAEDMLIARRLGLRLSQVPVEWRDEPGSKVRPLRDAFFSLGELLLVLWHDARGRYR